MMHISDFPGPTHLTDLLLDARIAGEHPFPAFVRDTGLRPFSESMARMLVHLDRIRSMSLACSVSGCP